jgi:hypothetical protein
LTEVTDSRPILRPILSLILRPILNSWPREAMNSFWFFQNSVKRLEGIEQTRYGIISLYNKIADGVYTVTMKDCLYKTVNLINGHFSEDLT